MVGLLVIISLFLVYFKKAKKPEKDQKSRNKNGALEENTGYSGKKDFKAPLKNKHQENENKRHRQAKKNKQEKKSSKPQKTQAPKQPQNIGDASKNKTSGPEGKQVSDQKTEKQTHKETEVKQGKVEAQKEDYSKPKYIGYNPINIFNQSQPYFYPYVLMPRPHSVIKFPRKGRKGRKGFKEADFKWYLENFFGDTFYVFDERFIMVKESMEPYEPDFTLTNEKRGLNLFLDIEIDEPYEGLNDIANRKATHFQGSNTKRDQAFQKRGWIVARFAEIQVHQQPLSCCLFIADLVKSINPEFKVPRDLLEVSKVSPIQQWSKEQATQWSKEKYRERYLTIERFGHLPETQILEEAKETSLGEEIENKVNNEGWKVEELIEDQYNLPVKTLIERIINDSKYLSFYYAGQWRVTKPNSVNTKSFTAFCFLKNEDLKFEIDQLHYPDKKENPFTVKESGPNLGLVKIRSLIQIGIDNGKLIRIVYTRSAWTEMEVDNTTGEVIENVTEAETSVRTVGNCELAKNTLDVNHLTHYNLLNNDYEYLHAYCHKREDERVFRFDRISEIAILNI